MIETLGLIPSTVFIYLYFKVDKTLAENFWLREEDAKPRFFKLRAISMEEYLGK